LEHGQESVKEESRAI